MHVGVALFDHLIDIVFNECIEILDLFACQAAVFGAPFGVLDKPDQPEPLLFRDIVHGLNVLPVALHKVALIQVMVYTHIQELFKSRGAQDVNELLARNLGSCYSMQYWEMH
eukprot:2179948-Ditylum_brightwellii.AAC.1